MVHVVFNPSLLAQIVNPIVPRIHFPLVPLRRRLLRPRLGILIAAPPRVQHALRLPTTRLQLRRDRDGLVAPEALAHINHALLALAVAALQLLALSGERVGEWRAQAVDGFVAVHEHAVRVLEALRERGAW